MTRSPRLFRQLVQLSSLLLTLLGDGPNPTLTLLANPPKRPMGTILEHNRGHWV